MHTPPPSLTTPTPLYPTRSYRTLCRCIVVLPDSGHALFTDADGSLLCYHPPTDAVCVASKGLFRRDYFGQYDPSNPGTMGYNWRQAVYVPAEQAVYGVHGNSGYVRARGHVCDNCVCVGACLRACGWWWGREDDGGDDASSLDSGGARERRRVANVVPDTYIPQALCVRRWVVPHRPTHLHHHCPIHHHQPPLAHIPRVSHQGVQLCVCTVHARARVCVRV